MLWLGEWRPSKTQPWHPHTWFWSSVERKAAGCCHFMQGPAKARACLLLNRRLSCAADGPVMRESLLPSTPPRCPPPATTSTAHDQVMATLLQPCWELIIRCHSIWRSAGTLSALGTNSTQWTCAPQMCTAQPAQHEKVTTGQDQRSQHTASWCTSLNASVPTRQLHRSGLGVRVSTPNMVIQLQRCECWASAPACRSPCLHGLICQAQGW